jgi:SAM-dependent methyltransferase
MFSSTEKAMPVRRIKNKVKRTLNEVRRKFDLRPPLPLPAGTTEKQLKDYLLSLELYAAPPEEIKNYCESDFRRFVYTFSLMHGLQGSCLELGANPYFLTLLLKEFSSLKLELANYFGEHPHLNGKPQKHPYFYKDFKTQERKSDQFTFLHFNVEQETFPYPDHSFDVVVFCEIIEHLVINPLATLKEIKRVLKPNGHLILTTPNVARLENVVRMIMGTNLYDPYSGHGIYGRHNREYTRHELYRLLDFAGFTFKQSFTADVHPNWAETVKLPITLKNKLWHRRHDLGQYIFIQAQNTHEAKKGLPSFLYRSFPEDQIQHFDL